MYSEIKPLRKYLHATDYFSRHFQMHFFQLQAKAEGFSMLFVTMVPMLWGIADLALESVFDLYHPSNNIMP